MFTARPYLRVVRVVLGVVSSIVDTAGQIGQSVTGVRVVAIGRGRVLALRPGAVLPGGARSGSPRHRSHPVNGFVLLSGLHQVSEEIVVRKMGFIN